MAISGRLKLAGLNPQVRSRAALSLDWADFFRIPVTVTSGVRSWAEQAALRRRWESGLSQFPANRPGDSSHQFGLAWDSIVSAADQADWDLIRRWAGFEVLERDLPHAQVFRWRDFV